MSAGREKPATFGPAQGKVQGKRTIGVTWPRKDTRETSVESGFLSGLLWGRSGQYLPPESPQIFSEVDLAHWSSLEGP